ncbi:hypothetical protein SAMN05421811_122123 [Nonomuraea wenchangensis]|uniref:Uncharacterized protein n=1 Tax=Nonomuraea wenchangensis TaxID=568860 RepID=A0A1I0LQ67_9ACTN|nr:hypothetical protein SAMN05421811_122123 [Nonomuraea wenchangensis]
MRRPTKPRAVAKATIHRLLSRRDIPLREKTLWRMLQETAARAAEILAGQRHRPPAAPPASLRPDSRRLAHPPQERC